MQPCMLQGCELMCKFVCNKENKHTVSEATCHLHKLTRDGSVSYVALKQKDDKGLGRTSFQ